MAVSVDFGPWELVHSPWQELIRKYDFSDLAGPGSETSVQLHCRLTVERQPGRFVWSAGHRKVRPFVYLVIDPYITEQGCYGVAIFGPSDKLVDYRILTVKIQSDARGLSFIVFDISDGFHLLDILRLCRQVTIRIMLTTGETVAHFPLENDPTFLIALTRLESRVFS